MLKIEFPALQVEVRYDALRFSGDGLFTSGSSVLQSKKRKIVERVGSLLIDSTKCFTLNNQEIQYNHCNPDGILVEAIQIEGHTDSDGQEDYNLTLSTSRANAAFFAMKNHQKNLLTYQNIRGQSIFSVAGYGEMRPITQNSSSKNKAENRRIDLRLIMYTPRNSEQVEDFKMRIAAGLKLLIEGVQSDP